MGRISRYDEIIIRIAPLYAPSEEALPPPTPVPSTELPENIFNRLINWMKSSNRSNRDRAQTYDAYLYTNLTIPGLDPEIDSLKDCEREISGLKLAGGGQIVVHWEQYQQYLSTFIKGERAAYKKFFGEKEEQQVKHLVNVRDQLFEISAGALQSLLNGNLDITDRPLRIWLHCTLPELTDLPWELLACELRKKEKARFSFVRGLPRRPIPKVSVTGKLRLAFIYEPEKAPDALIKAIHASKPELEVVEMTEPPREALNRAASEGFELVHLVTDAALSLGHNGLLYLRESTPDTTPAEPLNPMFRPFYRVALDHVDFFRHLIGNERLLQWNDKLINKLDIEPCSAEELSGIFRGSRVTLLSFSAPKTDDTQPGHFQGSLLPTVYSAFASLGTYSRLPNIIAPLGACDDKTLETFWRSFYSHLMKPPSSSRGFSLEESTAVALEAAPTALMALFLRQRLGREFTDRVAPRVGQGDEDVVRANARLQVERSLIEQLRAIDSNYMDVESKISETAVVQAASQEHTQLEEAISSLSQLEEEEL
jgi:hypothetical protein